MTPADITLPCSVPLLSASECQLIVEQLLDLEAFWLPRHPSFPFSTLGATHYYDITANASSPYARLARKYNPFLLQQFGPLYRTLLQTLRQYLMAEVEFMPDTALPGFHIFGGDSAFADSDAHDIMIGNWFGRREGPVFPGNPIHVDTAHLSLGLPQYVDGEKIATISFTLALAMPSQGAGLRLWPLTMSDLDALTDAQRLDLLRVTPSSNLAYECGSLFMHSGDYYHQARGLPVAKDEYRITLQGHGVWWRQRWQLCW